VTSAHLFRRAGADSGQEITVSIWDNIDPSIAGKPGSTELLIDTAPRGTARSSGAHEGGIELDVDEVLRSFHEQFSRLNHEFQRRSKGLRDVEQRRERLRALLRRHKQRRSEWERRYDEQSRDLDKRHAEQTRLAADLARDQAVLDVGWTNARERERNLHESEAELHRRWTQFTTEKLAEQEKRQALSHEQARLEAERRAADAVRSALAADQSDLAEQKRIFGESQASSEAERDAECARLEAEHEALRIARENLATDMVGLEADHVALEADRDRIGAERRQLEAAAADLSNQQAAIDSARVAADGREESQCRIDADLAKRSEQLGIESAAVEERRQALESEAQRLAEKERELDRQVDELAASRERLSADEADLRDSQAALGQELIRVVAAKMRSAAVPAGDRDPPDETGSAPVAAEPSASTEAGDAGRAVPKEPMSSDVASPTSGSETCGESDTWEETDGTPAAPVRDSERERPSEQTFFSADDLVSRSQTLRRVANIASRSALRSSCRKRLYRSLAVRVPLMVGAFAAAGTFAIQGESWTAAWQPVAIASFLVGLGMSVEVLRTLTSSQNALAVPKVGRP
jgi:hypothetical protein